ncbi:MAG TPA: prolyl oligopeptidase family serine peptidase, partial [Hyphomicrobiales bacterium]|nr:prolyl oligopeptidase family serine peptidase [Hyphomicrobiales bacterium]
GEVWPSPIAAAQAAEASLRHSEIAAARGRAIWVEARPSEQGRGVIADAGATGGPADLLAPPFSARTRVHEYGGGALLGDGAAIFFVNHADQDIWELPPAGEPVRLTVAGDTRFADMARDTLRERLVAVAERHGENGQVENFIAAIGLEGQARGKPQELVRGADFYARPRVSPDGRWLSWLEWSLPDMPWEGAVLKCARLGADGRPEDGIAIAGGAEGAAFQPDWAGDGRLFFVLEQGEWSGLYSWRDGEVTPLFLPQAELMRPLWAFSLRSYAVLDGGNVAAVAVRGGEHELWLVDTRSGEAAQMELPHRCIDDLAAAGGQRIYAIIADDEAVPAICEADLSGGAARWKVLARPGDMDLPAGAISRGLTRRLASGAGPGIPAVHYPPRNPLHSAAGRPAPMVVMAHGGPTGAAARGLQLKTQFWTSRGFAVLDVDYRGSTGYGRSHRMALQGGWGEIDAEDVIAAARAAVAEGLADPDRLVVTGRSAGGFTALCALMRSDIFRAASVHFGVADLATLLETTHKFEAGYLYGLTGTRPGATADVFSARSPLAQSARISSPVLLLQGLEDPAVPPSQARDIAASLKRRGVPVAHLEFPGEGHGFRQAETIRTAFQADLAFFVRVLDLACAEPLPDLTIFNWDDAGEEERGI